ncbi:MAG TPA: Flp pilus assembly protein CpaB [Fimbriiglobus sp.]|nr:Flp pilus assembly protein CpaB [Fimbriiglobus sp.]
MSVRTILVVALALVCGLSAAIGVGKYVKGVAAPEADTVPVVMAVADIPRFTTVTAEMLRVRDLPKSAVQAGSLARVEDVVDRVTDITILKDEPILEAKLSERGAGRGMAAVIPTGMRAVTIKTPNVASGVAGFILPGNKVDVLFTMKTHQLNDPTGGGSTTTLIQRVDILAVDQQIDAPSENKVNLKELKSVTLLVTPEQAAEIDLAQNLGTLTLALRNPQDTQPARTAPVTLKGIQFRQGKPWDERVQALMATASKVMTDFQQAAAKTEKEKADRIAKAEAEKAKAEAEKAAALAARAEAEKAARDAEPLPKIRTLRGGVPGQVTVN